MRNIILLLGLSVILASSGCSEHLSEPEQANQEDSLQIEWVNLGFEEASDLATAQERYLLVYTTADWCVWCRRMEENTWPDPAIISWVNANAIAFEWDLEDPTLEGLLPGIRGLPTVVLLYSGTEIGRLEGYMGPERYLAWFESIDAQ